MLSRTRVAKRDPIIQQVLEAKELSGLSNSQISKECGVAPSTLTNWDNEITMRPQNATIDATLRVLGLYRPIMRLPKKE